MTVYDQRYEPAPAAVAHPAHRTPTSTDTIAVDIDVAIGDGSIRFLAYPYQPASVFPTGLVVAAALSEQWNGNWRLDAEWVNWPAEDVQLALAG